MIILTLVSRMWSTCEQRAGCPRTATKVPRHLARFAKRYADYGPFFFCFVCAVLLTCCRLPVSSRRLKWSVSANRPTGAVGRLLVVEMRAISPAISGIRHLLRTMRPARSEVTTFGDSRRREARTSPRRLGRPACLALAAAVART